METRLGVEDGAGSDFPRGTLAAVLDRHLESPALSLPVCPESAARVLRELAEEDAIEDSLRRALSRDPALAACVLREANGPEFDALERIATIQRMLERLGVERVAGLVGSIMANARLESADPVLVRALHHTWKRSLAIALVSPTIAVRTGNDDLARDAEQLGLLADIGAVFLISALNSQPAQRDDRLALTATAVLEVLGQLRHVYGIRLLERWNAPPGVLAVLSGRPTTHVESRLSLFLRMARQIVSSIGLPPAGSDAAEPGDESELWELAEALDLSYVDVAALQVHAEDLVLALTAEAAPES